MSLGIPIDQPSAIRFLDEHLRDAEEYIKALRSGFEKPLSTAPSKPRRGMFAFADGVAWNPGSGIGLYFYNGTAWVFLGGGVGSKGDKGDPGIAATVEIGTVTTVSSGSPATVINSGTASAAILDFEIPQGATGADGASGSGSGGGELLMQDEVTSPPIPLETEDGTDWLYEG